jgi:hypothetical protein
MKPIESEGRFDDTRYDHPAFGCISITRSHGGNGRLFMSDVDHHHLICLEVATANMSRGLNHDKHFQGKTIVRLAMTPLQFAELVGNMSQGSGTPCTLEWVKGDGMLPPIHGESSTRRFSKEAKAEFLKLAKQIDEVVTDTRKALVEAKLSKPKQDAILAPLILIQRTLSSNLPFMQDMFSESLEKIVSEAKSIVESYAAERGLEANAVPMLIGKESQND